LVFFFFFSFLLHWDSNSGPLHQSFFVKFFFFFFEIKFVNYLPRLALNCYPPDLCLLSS
jgi:hypothetical protein